MNSPAEYQTYTWLKHTFPSFKWIKSDDWTNGTIEIEVKGINYPKSNFHDYIRVNGCSMKRHIKENHPTIVLLNFTDNIRLAATPNRILECAVRDQENLTADRDTLRVPLNIFEDAE